MNQSDKILELTKTLGNDIQNCDFYKEYEIAREKSDNDSDLQSAISEFNDLKAEINTIVGLPDGDKSKIVELNERLKKIYEDIMLKEAMVKFNKAKEDMDALMLKVNKILTSAINGEDLENIDLSGDDPCSSGGCGSCPSNCH
ncbi:MAG: YlbF family regulator [Oscillospiraceae bacterium]